MLSYRNVVLSLGLLLLLSGLSFWSIRLLRAPEARPANAPPTVFSAERAMRHVQQLARAPHAMGTAEHARVRTYLLNELRRMNLQPEVQEATVSNEGATRRWYGTTLGYVYNVMGRLRGRQPGPAILLMAHYDSQPNARGAADDGSSVATLLETARALQQSGPLQHDVILLFTDGEEYGLFGARAFLRHPWARDVRFVINLEARGTRGPSMTFEISPENGWAVEQLARSAPYPFASSLMYEVYRNLPNDTDFTIFREAGYTGVNSAFIDGFVHYHKLTDAPGNLSRNSLQHHGDNTLALVRQLGTVPLDAVKAPDKVFFNVAGSWLVQYPMRANWVWMALLTAALIGAFRTALRRQQATVGQTLAGLGLFVLVLAGLGGAVWLVNLGVKSGLPYTHSYNGTYGVTRFYVAYSLLTLGLFGLLVAGLLRWLKPVSLTLGAYLLLYLFTLVKFIWLPAATYSFLFPLLLALVGLLLALRTDSPGIRALVLVLGALPTLFMVLPLTWLLFITFDLALPVASAVVLGLVLGLLLPAWLLTEQGLRPKGIPLLPVAALLAGAALTLSAIRAEQPSAQQPLHSHVAYFLNADTGRAVWASDFERTDDWNRQFFPQPTSGALTDIYPTAQRAYLRNAAPAIAAPAPTAELLSDVTADSVRTLRLRLGSPRGAAHLEATLFPQAADDVRRLRLNDEPITPDTLPTPEGPAYDFVVYGLPVTKTVTLTVELTAGRPLRLLLYDQSIGLPGELVRRPRPAYVVPEQGRTSNLTVIRKTYQF